MEETDSIVPNKLLRRSNLFVLFCKNVYWRIDLTPLGPEIAE